MLLKILSSNTLSIYAFLTVSEEPLSLVSTTEELLDRKVAAPV
jgi:hypothetical protein